MYFDLEHWPDGETKRALMREVWGMMWEGWTTWTTNEEVIGE
jgi:hypothetical protein